MSIKPIILIGLIGALLFSVVPVHARLVANHSDEAFYDGDTGTEGAKPGSYSTIRELIIKGAEYFFKAQANINLLSEKVEMADLYGADFFTLWWAVNSALDNMNMARHYYRELQYKANRTPYNQVIINKLLDFDYDSFQEQNSLIKDVFSEVKGYLINGDVRGVYSHTSTYLDSLGNTLETIKEDLAAGKIPANDHMWSLNQVCVKAHMFGQYAARIFYAIK